MTWLPRTIIAQQKQSAAQVAVQPLLDDVLRQSRTATAPEPEQPNWGMPSLDDLVQSGRQAVGAAGTAVRSAAPAMPSFSLPTLEALGVTAPQPQQPPQQQTGAPPSPPTAASSPDRSAAGTSQAMPAGGGQGATASAGGSWEDRAYRAAVAAGHPDPDEFVEQIRLESKNFKPEVISGQEASSAGALGVSQIMPEVARAAGVDPLDPDAALTYAARRMAGNHRTYGNREHALAEYHMGAGNLQQYGPRGLEDTSAYIDAIGERANARRATSPRPAQTTPVQAEDTPEAQAQAKWGEYNQDTLTPNQFTESANAGLDNEAALAACGPAAAVAFARANGRNPTFSEAVQLAQAVGWNRDQGMTSGTSGEVDLLGRLGVKAQAGALDEGQIAQTVQAGRPVIVNAHGAGGHFYVATQYDPSTRKFNFGNSAAILRRSGGQTWFRLDELPSLGVGTPSEAIYMGTN